MAVSTLFVAPLVGVTTMTPRSRLVEIDVSARTFTFEAGQAVTVGLHATGSHATRLRRPYSIACSPERLAGTGRLELLVGINGSEELDWAVPGTLVDVEGPMGQFTFGAPPPGGAVLFVAGGTGIAPLRSMLGHALHLGPPAQIALLYSARRRDEFAFIDEFRALADAGRLELHQTVTRDESDAWQGRRGRIGRSEFASLLHEPASTLCLVCGPAEMVSEAVVTLKGLGVPDALIRTEQWGRQSSE